MADLEQDLRATEEDIVADSSRLAALEREKADLDPDDPRLTELSAEGEQLARRSSPRRSPSATSRTSWRAPRSPGTDARDPRERGGARRAIRYREGDAHPARPEPGPPRPPAPAGTTPAAGDRRHRAPRRAPGAGAPGAVRRAVDAAGGLRSGRAVRRDRRAAGRPHIADASHHPSRQRRRRAHPAAVDPAGPGARSIAAARSAGQFAAGTCPTSWRRAASSSTPGRARARRSRAPWRSVPGRADRFAGLCRRLPGPARPSPAARVLGAQRPVARTSLESWLGRPLASLASLTSCPPLPGRLRAGVASGRPGVVRSDRPGPVVDGPAAATRDVPRRERPGAVRPARTPLRPDPATPAPPRFLPEYDNVLLGHADRSRIIPPGRAIPLLPGNGATMGTILLDGMFGGTWRVRPRCRRGDAGDRAVRTGRAIHAYRSRGGRASIARLPR